MEREGRSALLVKLPYQLPDRDRPFCLVLADRHIDAIGTKLDRTFEQVVVAPSVASGPIYIVAHVVQELVPSASVIVAWLDGGESYRWAVEVGVATETRPAALVVGASPNPSWFWAGCLLWRCQRRGVAVTESIDDLISAAIVREQRRRQEAAGR
jgi:hypothetical protein